MHARYFPAEPERARFVPPWPWPIESRQLGRCDTGMTIEAGRVALIRKRRIMLHLIAVITAKPGQRSALLAAFQDNVPNVHAEPGCLEYIATIDADEFSDVQAQLGPDTFIVVEKWADSEALRAHMAAPHMAAYGAKTKDLVAQRLLHILTPA